MRFVYLNSSKLFIKNHRHLKTNQNPRHCGVFYNILKKGFFLTSLLWLVFSCSDADEIGLDLVDNRAKLQTLDTLTIKAFTARADSVATSLGRANVLGVIDDPVFGMSRAGIYTETRPPTVPLSLGENPVLDSISLVLAYTGGHYGALATNQTIRVYELSENFPATDTLFTNSTLQYHAELITLDPNGYRFRPAPADSVMVNNLMRPPQIRIPLSEAFGQKILAANDTEAFQNIPNYLEVFKGLYITVDEHLDGFEAPGVQPGRGSMFQIDMLSAFTAIEMHFHNHTDTVMLRFPYQSMRFPIDQFASHFTSVDHFGYDNVHEALKAQVVDGDQSVGDSLLFLQSLGQLRVDIQFPYLEQLLDQTWLINKAELIVPVQEGYASKLFPAADQLILLRTRDEGDRVLIDDYMLGLDFFGGTYDANNNRYVFNVSQYFQKLIDGEYPNTGLSMLISRGHERMSRVVLHGPGRSDEPMQLVLYYTVFE